VWLGWWVVLVPGLTSEAHSRLSLALPLAPTELTTVIHVRRDGRLERLEGCIALAPKVVPFYPTPDGGVRVCVEADLARPWLELLACG
jgi:hypothetical protein